MMEQGKKARANSDDGYKGWINVYLDESDINTVTVKEIRDLIVKDFEREDNELTAKDKKYLTQNIRRYVQSVGMRLNHNGKSLYATLVNREETDIPKEEGEEARKVRNELESAGEVKLESENSDELDEYFM